MTIFQIISIPLIAFLLYSLWGYLRISSQAPLMIAWADKDVAERKLRRVEKKVLAMVATCLALFCIAMVSLL